MSDQRPSPGGTDTQPSLGDLVGQMTEQTSRLIRDELRLAQAEMAEKGKRAGIGAGLFGGAGVFAVYGLGALVAAAILGLAQTLDGWLSALIVAAALFVVAGISALVGKKEISQATPPLPADARRGHQAGRAGPQAGRHRMTESDDTVSDAPAAEPEGMTEIKADIERTRAELSDTVDELAHRLDVKAQVGEKAESVKESVVAKATQVQESAPPNTAKFVAAGAAVLVVLLVVRRVRRR